MWKLVQFEEDEVEGDKAAQLYQFNFDLMCAELVADEWGIWFAALIDSDGDETWVSEAFATPDEAKEKLRAYLFDQVMRWLATMREELPHEPA